MKLVLLGTTGYHPTDRRQTACFMLPEIGVVLDAGTGMFRVAQHLATDTLDVFLTHVHLDHVVGVSFLFDVLCNRPMQHVRVHAEREKIAAVEERLIAPPFFPVALPCEYAALDGPVSVGGGGVATHFALSHPDGSVGFRLDWPERSLAYVSDTTASVTASYVDKIWGVDVLLHECYFGDGDEKHAALTGHSCLTQVLRVAAAAQVGRLILVHINPLYDDDAQLGLEAARHLFPNTTIGVDGMTIEF